MTYLRLVLENGLIVLEGPYPSRYLAELRLHVDARGRVVNGQRVIRARIVVGAA